MALSGLVVVVQVLSVQQLELKLCPLLGEIVVSFVVRSDRVFQELSRVAQVSALFVKSLEEDSDDERAGEEHGDAEQQAVGQPGVVEIHDESFRRGVIIPYVFCAMTKT